MLCVLPSSLQTYLSLDTGSFFLCLQEVVVRVHGSHLSSKILQKVLLAVLGRAQSGVLQQ